MTLKCVSLLSKFNSLCEPYYITNSVLGIREEGGRWKENRTSSNQRL